MIAVAVALWVWNNTAGNVLATVMCGVAVWFWKIRPHLRRQAAHIEDARQRHETTAGLITGLHGRLDAAGIPGTKEGER